MAINQLYVGHQTYRAEQTCKRSCYAAPDKLKALNKVVNYRGKGV